MEPDQIPSLSLLFKCERSQISAGGCFPIFVLLLVSICFDGKSWARKSQSFPLNTIYFSKKLNPYLIYHTFSGCCLCLVNPDQCNVNQITIWWPTLYLQISALSSCRPICCRCPMSRGGRQPVSSSRPHPQIAAGYGGLSHCDQQQQHITPDFFPALFFPIATITCSIWAVSEKAKSPVNVSRSDFFGQDKESL